MLRGNPLRSKWSIPFLSLIAGVGYLVAFSLGGHPGLGALGLAVMVLFGLGVLAAGASETVRGLRGDGRDERFALLDLRATACAGLVLILAVIVAFMIDTAHGGSGQPYSWLGAIAGLTYLAAVAYLRVRG
jgi:hypothetical protein